MSSSKRWSAYDVLRRDVGALEPCGALVGEGVEADPLLAAGAVEEEVGGDAVQPALERAGRVGVERAEDPDEDLLREVLGVGAVAGEAVGQAEDAIGVVLDDLVPRRHADGGFTRVHHRCPLALELLTEQCPDLRQPRHRA